MSRAGLLVLVTVFATGCTMTTSSRRTLLVAGAGLTVGGIVVGRAGVVDSDGNGQNDTHLNDDFRLYYASSVMVLSGLVVMLAALASQEPVEPPIVLDTNATTFARSPSISEPAPDLQPSVPQPTVTIERTPAIPLPDLATTDPAHRLARQLRSASMHGHCDVAWIMWRDLEKLDADYARAVRDGPVMARCAGN